MEHGVEYVYSVYRACVGEGKKNQGRGRLGGIALDGWTKFPLSSVKFLFCFASPCFVRCWVVAC